MSLASPFLLGRFLQTASWSRFHFDSFKTNGSAATNHQVEQFIGGTWRKTEGEYTGVPDPLQDGRQLFLTPGKASSGDLNEFKKEINAVPRHGLFNAFKNVAKFSEMGDVMSKLARSLHDPAVFDHFTRLIQYTMPKSRIQAEGEVRIVRDFCENYSSDRVRYLMRGFSQAGDRDGQESRGYRFPFGATSVIAPFNFPLEIAGMQFLSSVVTGNYCMLKPSVQVSLVMEEFCRLALHCGLDPQSFSFCPFGGRDTESILTDSRIQTLQFTGSTWVGEHLAEKLRGRVRLEDAGFDVKIIGPDVKTDEEYKHIIWQCDQDAYAISGQKCSAQSFLAIHENWIEKTDILDDLKKVAAERDTDSLALGPLLGESPEKCLEHVRMLKSLPGGKLLFGGQLKSEISSMEAAKVRNPEAIKPLIGKPHHQMAILEPTAVFVPLEALRNLPVGHAAFSELFGPCQLVTSFSESEKEDLFALIDSFSHHLTSAIVSEDVRFTQYALGHAIHGCTYFGNRARTTGAPQNHWFGPSGDPRGAGIGTDEAILLVWTCHRELIQDIGSVEGLVRSCS